MTDRTAAHTELRNAVLAALSAAYHPAGVFWPVNVGIAKRGDAVIRFGLRGQADIQGCVGGRHVEIEIKTGAGRQRPGQQNWQAAIERAGAIYLVARSVEQAIADIASRLSARAAA